MNEKGEFVKHCLREVAKKHSFDPNAIATSQR